jgi:NlpC/P60 family putative phage cell wall peptidase
VTRDDIVAEARTWLGTPWHHGQHLKGVGTDCVGFVYGVANALGIMGELPVELRGYGRHPNAVLLYRACDKFMVRIPKSEAGLGDVLVMRFETDPQHFGIITSVDPVNMMHAHTPRRMVVEHGLRADWPARVVAAYRMPGVD